MEKATINTPIGHLTIVAENEALKAIIFGEQKGSDQHSPFLDLVGTQLQEYFDGKRIQFDLKLAPDGTKFQQSVWSELLKIPFGKTITYSELALRLGDLKTIRAAGTANGKNPIPIIIPCHRVIGKDGSLVGFSGGLPIKEKLLQHEGVLKGEQMNIFG